MHVNAITVVGTIFVTAVFAFVTYVYPLGIWVSAYSDVTASTILSYTEATVVHTIISGCIRTVNRYTVADLIRLLCDAGVCRIAEQDDELIPMTALPDNATMPGRDVIQSRLGKLFIPELANDERPGIVCNLMYAIMIRYLYDIYIL